MTQLSLLDAVEPPVPGRHGTPLRDSRGTDAELPHRVAGLEKRLQLATGGPVALTITDNRRTMVSVRREARVRHVRLHHMFLDATPEVIHAVGRYVARADRFASAVLDQFIEEHQIRIRADAVARPARIRTRGVAHDLEEILQSLRARYFDATFDVAISWGRGGISRGRRRARRTIRMGAYAITDRAIRIHPVLDQTFVPRYFVEWVVYHEMLHHIVPMPTINGRRVYHSTEFRRRERMFDEYLRARAWESAHLPRLIRSRNSLAIAASPPDGIVPTEDANAHS